MLIPEIADMRSHNFEFLRAKREVLADLGGFAERYAHEDPAGSLLKQRSFVEIVVAAIYDRYRLCPPLSDNLNDLMNAEPFRQSVPDVVQNKLHAVRKSGNHAAHPRRPITSQLSLDCLAQLFDVARWFHVQVDGIVYAGDYSGPNLPTPFADYYLAKMAAASATAGKTLLDVFDVHYYTSGGSAGQCAQAPRMFWDPSFTKFTAAQTDSIDFGWSGQNNYFDTALYPRQMIPRLQAKIATAYASSAAAPGLSFSEYNAGCETTVEGGVAQADLLGIFGREGVYAAMAWPLHDVTDTKSKALVNYLVAAYDSYRNYDGAGSTVGDTAVRATTSNVDGTSVYAFAHSGDATKVEVVGINKTSGSLTVAVTLANAPALTSATLYLLTAAKVGVVASSGTPPTPSCAGGTCSLQLTLPAMSVTTVVLR